MLPAAHEQQVYWIEPELVARYPGETASGSVWVRFCERIPGNGGTSPAWIRSTIPRRKSKDTWSSPGHEACRCGYRQYCSAFALLPRRRRSCRFRLAKMDAAASKFKGMTANVQRGSQRRDRRDSVDRAHEDETSPRAGHRMIVDFARSRAKTVSLQGQHDRHLHPKIQTVQEYDVGKNRDPAGSFFLLGFGSSGKDLAAGVRNLVRWEKKPSAAPSAAHLLLLPKVPEVPETAAKGRSLAFRRHRLSRSTEVLSFQRRYMHVTYSRTESESRNCPIPL